MFFKENFISYELFSCNHVQLKMSKFPCFLQKKNLFFFFFKEKLLVTDHERWFFFFLIISTFLIIIYLFIWLCWVFVSVRGLSLAAASGGHSSSRCVGLSLSWPLLLWSTGSRRADSIVVAHGPSCSVACGIFPDQGSNPCPLH